MMKSIYILIILSSLVNGQVYEMKITYDMTLNFGSPKLYDAQLYLTENKSVFIFNEKGAKSNIYKNTDAKDDYKFNITISDSTKYFVQTDGVETIQLEKDLNSKNYLIVYEDYPVLNWEIQEEKKTIGGYLCLKATTWFRGRNYIAWFAESVPITYGPYKFNGLPGLIMEIYDEQKEVYFGVREINKVETDSKDILPQMKLERISRAQYKERVKNFYKDLDKRINAKLGRGMRVTKSSVKMNSIEL